MWLSVLVLIYACRLNTATVLIPREVIHPTLYPVLSDLPDLTLHPNQFVYICVVSVVP